MKQHKTDVLETNCKETFKRYKDHWVSGIQLKGTMS